LLLAIDGEVPKPLEIVGAVAEAMILFVKLFVKLVIEKPTNKVCVSTIISKPSAIAVPFCFNAGKLDVVPP
jgi:hypothetical protein